MVSSSKLLLKHLSHKIIITSLSLSAYQIYGLYIQNLKSVCSVIYGWKYHKKSDMPGSHGNCGFKLLHCSRPKAKRRDSNSSASFHTIFCQQIWIYAFKLKPWSVSLWWRRKVCMILLIKPTGCLHPVVFEWQLSMLAD
jgi:hypothetical protein